MRKIWTFIWFVQKLKIDMCFCWITWSSRCYCMCLSSWGRWFFHKHMLPFMVSSNAIEIKFSLLLIFSETEAISCGTDARIYTHKWWPSLYLNIAFQVQALQRRGNYGEIWDCERYSVRVWEFWGGQGSFLLLSSLKVWEYSLGFFLSGLPFFPLSSWFLVDWGVLLVSILMNMFEGKSWTIDHLSILILSDSKRVGFNFCIQ